MEEDAEEISETLNDARESVQKLKDQRSKLFEANQKLAELLKVIERRMSEKGLEPEEGHSYSFGDGWQKTSDQVELGGVSEEDIDQQISRLDKLLQQYEDL